MIIAINLKWEFHNYLKVGKERRGWGVGGMPQVLILACYAKYLWHKIKVILWIVYVIVSSV